MLPKAKAFPKLKRIPRNYPNNKATIMGVFRAADYDSQHLCFGNTLDKSPGGKGAGAEEPGGNVKELDAQRLRTAGVFVPPLLDPAYE